jgi:hypothetical protein
VLPLDESQRYDVLLALASASEHQLCGEHGPAASALTAAAEAWLRPGPKPHGSHADWTDAQMESDALRDGGSPEACTARAYLRLRAGGLLMSRRAIAGAVECCIAAATEAPNPLHPFSWPIQVSAA